MTDENLDDGLSLEDLTNVLRIINTATERGAFRANELSLVGSVYDKYSRFIKQASQPATETETQTEGTTDDGN